LLPACCGLVLLVRQQDGAPTSPQQAGNFSVSWKLRGNVCVMNFGHNCLKALRSSTWSFSVGPDSSGIYAFVN